MSNVNDYLNQAPAGRRFVKLPSVGDEMVLVVGPMSAAKVVDSTYEGKVTLDGDGNPVQELQLPAVLESHSAEGSRGYDGPKAGDKVTWTVKTGARTALKESLGEAGQGLEDGLRIRVERTKDRKTGQGKAFTYEVEVLGVQAASATDAEDAKAALKELD